MNKDTGSSYDIRCISKQFPSKTLYTFDNIIGQSPQIKNLISECEKISNTPSTVLIHGSSGCGKELIAQAIHSSSPLRDGPFVALNCGAIPKNLIESELFGYESGSFTGAKQSGYPGKFEIANNGTIFLDEIGEMPIDMQVTLLRVLQERYVTRLGSKKCIPINARVIAATNKDLKKEIKNNTFRQDLFYRLNVIPIKVPDLKDRIGDIPILIDYFLHIKSKELHKPIPTISSSLYNKMLSYCWPGNVRELENCIENIVILNGRTTYELNFDECHCMTIDNLGNPIETENPKYEYDLNKNNAIVPLKLLEEREIKKSLIVCKGNVSKAASKLGISRNTLYAKMKKYNIEVNKIATKTDGDFTLF